VFQWQGAGLAQPAVHISPAFFHLRGWKCSSSVGICCDNNLVLQWRIVGVLQVRCEVWNCWLCQWKDWLCLRHIDDWCEMSKALNYEQNYSFLFEILTLLGYYAACVDSWVVVSWCFGTAHGSYSQGSNLECLCLKIGNLKSWNVMFIRDTGRIFSLWYVLKNCE